MKAQNDTRALLASIPGRNQLLDRLASTLGHKTAHIRSLADLVNNDKLAANGSAMIDVPLIVGIFAAVLLADRAGRIRLQVVGFIGSAIGLFMASLSASTSDGTQTALIFIGFMLFNFMTNMGPNAQTHLLAGEVFPTRIRAQGAGFAAAFAKVGAVTTAYLFPVLLADIGTRTVLSILVCTSRSVRLSPGHSASRQPALIWIPWTE